MKHKKPSNSNKKSQITMSGDDLREARKRLNLSQRGLLDLLATKGLVYVQSSLSEYENGRHPIPEKLIQTIKHLMESLRPTPPSKPLQKAIPKAIVPKEDNATETLRVLKELSVRIDLLSRILIVKMHQEESDDFDIDAIDDPIVRGFIRFIDNQAKGA